MDKLESKLMPIAQAISKNKYLLSIRDGFLISMPLLVVGSMFMLISNFPVQPWIDLLKILHLTDLRLHLIFQM